MKDLDDIPTEEAMDLNKRGLKKGDIVKKLEEKGYRPQQINDAFNQIDIKSGISGKYPYEDVSHPGMESSVLNLEEEAPSPTQMEEREIPQQRQNISTPQIPQVTQRDYSADTEELIEAVIEEKWQEFMDRLGDMESWKIRTDDDITSIKQEVIRLGKRFDNLQSSIVQKVGEYNQNIMDVNTEIKALERVFQNIIDPLTNNIKELGRITKDLKGNKTNF